jgi:bifunctional non-homologous end joining protein LigD
LCDNNLVQGAAMVLENYRKKRHFDLTSEPEGEAPTRKRAAKTLRYVIQKHRASHLHYDFRLEWNGVLLSWAVPKGPSVDPSVKRLAASVEDHPLEYGDFEGVIPAGQYGGGAVMVWDTGSWKPEVSDVDEALRKGELKFTLHGKRLKGSWELVRTRGFGKSPRPSWLLIKHRDACAHQADVTVDHPRSAVSNRNLAQIARDGGGNVERAATGDP